MSATGTETDAGQKPVIALYDAAQLQEFAEVMGFRYAERNKMNACIALNDVPGAREQVAIVLAERHRSRKLSDEGYIAFEGLGFTLNQAMDLADKNEKEIRRGRSAART